MAPFFVGATPGLPYGKIPRLNQQNPARITRQWVGGGRMKTQPAAKLRAGSDSVSLFYRVEKNSRCNCARSTILFGTIPWGIPGDGTGKGAGTAGVSQPVRDKVENSGAKRRTQTLVKPAVAVGLPVGQCRQGNGEQRPEMVPLIGDLLGRLLESVAALAFSPRVWPTAVRGPQRTERPKFRQRRQK